MQYINRTQEPGEVAGPMVPTVAIAKQDDISKFNEIAQEVIEPPPIKELTPEEKALVTGEIMQAARGYDDMQLKAVRILSSNPELEIEEAEALAQYIHHTYYSDMNRVLYMNNLELQEDGTYNVTAAKDENGNLIAPLLTSGKNVEVIDPTEDQMIEADEAEEELAKLEIKKVDDIFKQMKLQETVIKGKTIEELQKLYKEEEAEALEFYPADWDNASFEEWAQEKGANTVASGGNYTAEGVEVMKAVDKAFKNALHKLDKATPEAIAERYAEGNRHSGEFAEWDGNYRRFVDFDTPEALEGFLKQYTENVGENIIHPAATSTTWRNSHAHFDKKDSLVIKVLPKKEDTEGVLVDRFKNLADEAEVLYPPGQKFKVVSVGQSDPETPTLSKSLDTLGLEEFSKDLAFKIFETDAEELKGSKFLTEFKKELEFSIDDELDINWIAPDMLKVMSKVGELEPPTMEDMKNSPEWAKVLPDDYVFTKMIKGEFEIPEALKKRTRREVILQEV